MKIALGCVRLANQLGMPLNMKFHQRIPSYLFILRILIDSFYALIKLHARSYRADTVNNPRLIYIAINIATLSWGWSTLPEKPIFAF